MSQILSLRNECKSRLSNFLIIGLCSSSANYWFCTKADLFRVAMVSDRELVTAQPEVSLEDFLSKTIINH